MGKRGPKPKPVAAPPLKAKGKGPVKRTPTSAFDAAANDDNVHQCEKIVGQRLAKGVTQFCVKWAGYDTKDNTWEPIENLAGCESFIADFKEREKTRIAQLEAAAEQKHRENEAAAAQLAADQAQAAADARLNQPETAATEGGEGPKRSPRKAVADATPASEQKHTRRTAVWWTSFDETGAPPGKTCCKLLKSDGTTCGEQISTRTVTNLKNHVMYKHPDEYIRLAPASEPLNIEAYSNRSRP